MYTTAPSSFIPVLNHIKPVHVPSGCFFEIHFNIILPGQERILSIEGGSSRSHYVEESFWKRLWTCRLTDYWWCWWLPPMSRFPKLPLSCRFLPLNTSQLVSLTLYMPHAPSIASCFWTVVIPTFNISRNLDKNHTERERKGPTKFNKAVLCALHVSST